MSFGNPITNSAGQRWGLRQQECIELRRMFFTDALPRNSESRALAVAAQLVKKRYARYKLMLTYVEDDQPATAYRAAGWIEIEKYTYVGRVLVNGEWLTMRNANRRGGLSRLSVQDKEMVTRRKLVLPLNADVAQLVERLSTRQQAGGSSPTHPLSDSARSHAMAENRSPRPTELTEEA